MVLGKCNRKYHVRHQRCMIYPYADGIRVDMNMLAVAMYMELIL